MKLTDPSDHDLSGPPRLLSHAEAMQRARERHGKPFLAHTLKPRETEPTRTLIELNHVSNPRAVIVLANRMGK